MIRVSIVSPKVSLDAISQVISSRDFGCEFIKYVYDRLEDIKDIYEACKDSCDVIFFSGELGYHYILNTIAHIEIPCSFICYEPKHILSILLNFVLRHPEIPLSRVYVDFLTPLNNYMDIKKYLAPAFMPQCYENLEYNYERLMERAHTLCAQHKIDYILTRCTNNLDQVKALGLPFQHILPSEEIIAESITNAVNSVRLTLKAPAIRTTIIVKLHSIENTPKQDLEYWQVTLHKYLVDFRREQGSEFTIVPTNNRFELYAESSESGRVDIACALIAHLREQSGLEFRVGAGVEESLDKSHYLAEIALQEAIRYGKNDGFLMDGDGTALTGPLSLSRHLTYSYSNNKAVAYSQEKGINEQNLLKIVGLFQLDPQIIITSASLAQWLNITQRSCNRILSQLLESGLIEELPAGRPVGKGRPSKQYCFVEKSCMEVFL